MADSEPASQGGPSSRPHRDNETTSWVVGVLLILLGIAFLLQNAGMVALTGNWWAIFIYVAAFASFANAWRAYRSQDKTGKSGTGSLIWGLVFTVAASIFVLNLEWDQWWPAILVAVGIGIVVGRAIESRAA